VTVRATAIEQVPHPNLIARPKARQPARPQSLRRVWFTSAHDFLESQIWARDDLSTETEITGPAVIEEWNTTILVAPNQTATVDDLGSVVVHLTDSQASGYPLC
jgi:N-methylhydantoinase A